MNQNQQSNQMTNDQNDRVVSALKNLIEICHTGHEGYSTSAENVKNPEYAALFRSFAQQRQTFENELKQLVRRFGDNPENENAGGLLTDAAGALHRGWINLKAAVSGGSESAILDECERGDEAAVKAYQEAMEEPLPQDVAQVVRQQYQSVQEAYSRVKGLSRASA